MLSSRLKLNADKTELLWAGSGRGYPFLGDCSPTLQFAVDTVVPSNDVPVPLKQDAIGQAIVQATDQIAA